MDLASVLETLTALVGLAAAIAGWRRRGATTSSRAATTRLIVVGSSLFSALRQ